MPQNRKFNFIITMGIFALLTSLFQNWNYIDIGGATIIPVNEEIRQAHARELLGRVYSHRNAGKSEYLRDLNQRILDDVKRSLPKSQKKLAAKITKAIIEESQRHNLDPVFVFAVIKTESSFNTKTVGGVGEIGLMQIRPETAAWITKKFGQKYHGKKSLFNPVENIKIGTLYISYLREKFSGSASKYLSAYNMGPRNVKRLIAQNIKPKEYAVRVMSNYRDFYADAIQQAKSSGLQAKL